MAYDEELLTEEEIKGIEESLEDIKAGRVYNEEETKRMLGLED
jgi:predicted transcriptional regulator